MTAEQQGVSSATAGGASASKLCFAPVGQNGRGLAIRCDLPWGHPGAHHGVAGIDYGLTARATIPEPFRRMFWVAAEDIANVIGCTVVEGEARGYDETDPRDAEIERLRGKLDNSCVVVGDLCKERDEATAELERIAAFVGGSAAMPGSVRSAVEHAFSQRDKKRDAEIEQLRGTLQEIADLVAADATRPDSVRSAVENWLFELDQRRGERDEARMEWKRADAEVTRLRGEVDEHRKLAADLLNRTLEEVAGRTTADMIEEVGARWGESGDRGWRDSERWRKRAETAEAERDRLRQQPAQHLADENSAQAANDRLRDELARERAIYADSPDDRLYHAADNTWWQRADDGRLVSAEPPETVAQSLAENQSLRWTLASLKGGIAAAERLLKPTKDPAEPRRWHAGEPEPEIGTTVTWGFGGTSWTRCGDGAWRSDTCKCKSCRTAPGLSWTVLIDEARAPLFEVVNSDG